MSLSAIFGLLVFNITIVGVGTAALFALRGWDSWSDFARYTGLAYFLGLALFMVSFALVLVSGLRLGLGAMVAVAALIAGVGVVVGAARRNSLPRLSGSRWRHRPDPISWVSAVFAAGLVVYLEGLFRAARLAPIAGEWDGWAFWVPKAQAIYHFGRLEAEVLSLLPPPSATYPPGLPVVHAGAFHAIGSADVVTLHLQYWFYAVAFVAAVSGLLWPRVRGAILLPVLLLGVVMPSYLDRATMTYADVVLGYLVVLAALTAYLWLEDRKRWRLAVLGLLLAAAILTKREGSLFALCVLLAALVASLPERRFAWPRIALTGAAALAAAIAWRIWSASQGLPSDAPEAGYAGSLAQLDRAWPAFELVLATVFDTSLWWVTPVLGVLAIGVALVARAWRISAFALVVIGATLLATTWAIWSNPSLPFTDEDGENPVVRIAGTPLLLVVGLTPLLLQQAWSNAASPLRSSGVRAPRMAWTRSTYAWLVIAAAALAYPASMVAGYSGETMPGGAPRFPSVEDCMSRSDATGRVQVVLGYADVYPEASALRQRAASINLPAAGIEADGCGRLRVSVRDLTPAEGRAVLEGATSAGLVEATLEADPRS